MKRKREREREREGGRERIRVNPSEASRQSGRQASRYPVLLAIRALDGTQGLFAAGSSAHAGPLICDPDPPYLSNPEYGFHLNSGRSDTCTPANSERTVYERIAYIHPRQDLHGAHPYTNTSTIEKKKRKKKREMGIYRSESRGKEENASVHAARIVRKKALSALPHEQKGNFLPNT